MSVSIRFRTLFKVPSATHRQMQSATNHLFFLVALQMVKSIVNPIHALMFNLQQTMKEIEAIYYFEEYGNDKHIVLWTFALQMLIRDHISHQHQRRFCVVKKRRRKRSIFRPVWTKEETLLRLWAQLTGWWVGKRQLWWSDWQVWRPVGGELHTRKYVVTSKLGWALQFSVLHIVVCEGLEFLQRILVQKYSCISRMGQA